MVRGLEKILMAAILAMLGHYRARVRRLHYRSCAHQRARRESALGIAVPPTAELIRNHDGYAVRAGSRDPLLSPSCAGLVDIVNALKADPKKAASWRIVLQVDKNTPAYFSEVQDKIKAFAASGLASSPMAIGPPAYKLPPEVNLIAVAHYLDALQWQKEIVKITPSSRQESASELPVAAFLLDRRERSGGHKLRAAEPGRPAYQPGG